MLVNSEAFPCSVDEASGKGTNNGTTIILMVITEKERFWPCF